MSGEETPSGEKQHEPTERRLQEARERGDVVQSTELLGAAVYGGYLLVSAAFGGALLVAFAAPLAHMLAEPEALSRSMLGSVPPPAIGLVPQTLVAVVPFFLVPAALVLAVLAAKRALVIAPDRIVPRFSRLNPVANAAHKFGPEGLAEFAKGLAKLLLAAAGLAVLLVARADTIALTQLQGAGAGSAVLIRLTVEFLAVLAALAAAVGAVDFIIQRFMHRRRNRMSHQDMRDELRQSEGDPHMRMSRRQRAQQIASDRMMRDVTTASVVLVNPTHYAVALRWSRGDRTAPVCVAKGTDGLAARIREVAAAAGVPVRRDPATARSLHAAVEVGQQIRPEHYAAVAAAIRYAEDMRRRARGRWTP